MKDCPDLTKMTDSERQSFWQSTNPRKLRRLGDRLLAESLPEFAGDSPRDQLAQAAREAREAARLSLEDAASSLGVTVEMLAAWEDDRVHPPASLPHALRALAGDEGT